MDQPDQSPELLGGFERAAAKQTAPIFNVEQIAEVCHEANRVIQRFIGDEVSPAWKDAPDWQRESTLEGTAKSLHPQYPSQYGEHASHDSWMEKKLRDGWRYGPKKDGEAKTHPCLLPYDSLPLEQKAKDGLFVSIVHILGSYRR